MHYLFLRQSFVSEVIALYICTCMYQIDVSNCSEVCALYICMYQIYVGNCVFVTV